jgi:hypothetical protein
LLAAVTIAAPVIAAAWAFLHGGRFGPVGVGDDRTRLVGGPGVNLPAAMATTRRAVACSVSPRTWVAHAVPEGFGVSECRPRKRLGRRCNAGSE